MKKLTLLILLTASLFSCKDDDELKPLGLHFSGTYERSNYAEEDGIWYVHSLVFQDNGDLEQRTTIRESEHGEDLGYAGLVLGTYELQTDELTWDLEEFYFWASEDPEELYGPRTGLVPLEEATPVSQTGTLEQRDEGNKIAIVFPCNDVRASCIGEMIYTKVD